MNETTQTLKPTEKQESTFGSLAKPETAEGEIYVGAIIDSTGHGHHVVLLAAHPEEEMNWQAAMDYAKDIGGDLPNRDEQALLYDQCKEHFDKEWYWSNSQHAAHAGYAWFQSFRNGTQLNRYKRYELRARAVRRVLI